MFWIRGSDGQQDGPYPAGVLRGWILSGRVQPTTPARRDVEVEWRQISDYPELDLRNATLPPSLPPPLPASGRPISPPPPASVPRTSRWAVASLVLGCVGFLFVTGIAGVVAGIVATVRIGRNPTRLRGQGLAVAGIVVSLAMLVLGIAGFILIQVAGDFHRRMPPQADCSQSLQQLGTALRQYAHDHGDVLPPATNWCDQVQGYTSSLSDFVCPSRPSAQGANFVLNHRVAGMNLEELDLSTVLLFEADRGWNAAGEPDASLSESWVYTAGGQVLHLDRGQLRNARWTP